MVVRKEDAEDRLLMEADDWVVPPLEGGAERRSRERSGRLF